MDKLIDSLKILDEMSRLLTENFPECKAVYLHLVPQDFERPCFLLETVTSTHRTINARTIEKTYHFTITVYDVTEQPYDTPQRLAQMQQQAVSLFEAGVLKVEDRALKIKSSAGERKADKAYVKLQVNFFEQRSTDVPLPPMMKNIQTKLNEEE